MKTWRGHNKEWNISAVADRRQYLIFLQQELNKQSNTLSALVLMGNHVHEIFFIDNPQTFSRMMRNHHSRYGAYFNKLNNRCGKVAQDRPYTSLIQNDAQAMITTFYLLANPLRAGICKDPRNYYFSSYRFYAFGQRPNEMPFLTYPDWYLSLAHTPESRQRIFRRLFFDYLRTKGLIALGYSRLPYLGDPVWAEYRKQESKNAIKRALDSAPP